MIFQTSGSPSAIKLPEDMLRIAIVVKSLWWSSMPPQLRQPQKV